MSDWRNAEAVSPREFTCGHCDRYVASNQGYRGGPGAIYVCPGCLRPTFFDAYDHDRPYPGVAFGDHVDSLPPEVDALYQDARNCMKVDAFTPAVLACRKLLMNIAVTQGAPEGKSFVEYVDYLADKGFVPPNGRAWVDHIRKRGNDANHEIPQMGRTDAEELLTFLAMLLKFIYEFPAKVPQVQASP